MDCAGKVFHKKSNFIVSLSLSLSLSLITTRLVTDMDGMTILKTKSNSMDQIIKSQTLRDQNENDPKLSGSSVFIYLFIWVKLVILAPQCMGKVCESENACLTWSVKPAFSLLTMFPLLLKNQTLKTAVFRGSCI